MSCVASGIMASIRKTTVVMQREALAKSCAELVEPSPSPKLLYSQSYVTMRGWLTSLASLDFILLLSRIKSLWAAICSHRSSRFLERPKVKLVGWKKIAFRLFVFYMIGIFIGFMPFFSCDDVVDKIASESERHPFGESLKANNIVEEAHIEQIQQKEEARVQEKQVQAIDEPKPESEVTPAVILGAQNSDLKEKNPPALISAAEKSDSKEKDAREDPPGALSISPSFNDSGIVVRKLLMIVTITSFRPLQAYYLTRLSHILKAVPAPLLWLVVEWPYQSTQTAKILQASGVMYRHLVCRKDTNSTRKIIVCQKNAALYHIKKHHLDGILHFADEEKVYSADLFEDMRQIRRFGTWPVAVHAGTKKVLIEGPRCSGNQVTGWHGDQRKRRFPVGYSGFAFNSTILWDRQRWPSSTSQSIMIHTAGKGTQESRFIEKLVDDESQMEGLGENCTRIMVWNFNLEIPQLNYPMEWSVQHNLPVVVPVT